MVRPATLNAQGFLNSASGALAIAARAAAALRSNSSRMRALLSRASNLGGGPPGGMMSSSSRVMAFTAQAGSSATSVASRPSVIDLGWGLQEDFPSGTRSSTWRVAVISSSNSGSSQSARGIRELQDGLENAKLLPASRGCKNSSQPLRASPGPGRPRQALVQRHGHEQIDVIPRLIGQIGQPTVVPHVDPVVPALEQQRIALLLQQDGEHAVLGLSGQVGNDGEPARHA